MRMRRILTVLAVACLLVAVMATTGAAKGKSNVNRWEVLVIPNVDTEVYYEWGWTLYEEITTLDGEHLGWSGGSCVNLVPDVGEDVVCNLGMRFPDGDITVNGPLNINEWIEGETVMPVTGGTGAFRNVRGEVAIVPEEDFSSATLIFDLKRSKAGY